MDKPQYNYTQFTLTTQYNPLRKKTSVGWIIYRASLN
jgi:hypothetical protein